MQVRGRDRELVLTCTSTPRAGTTTIPTVADVGHDELVGVVRRQPRAELAGDDAGDAVRPGALEAAAREARAEDLDGRLDVEPDEADHGCSTGSRVEIGASSWRW